MVCKCTKETHLSSVLLMSDPALTLGFLVQLATLKNRKHRKGWEVVVVVVCVCVGGGGGEVLTRYDPKLPDL